MRPHVSNELLEIMREEITVKEVLVTKQHMWPSYGSRCRSAFYDLIGSWRSVGSAKYDCTLQIPLR